MEIKKYSSKNREDVIKIAEQYPGMFPESNIIDLGEQLDRDYDIPYLRFVAIDNEDIIGFIGCKIISDSDNRWYLRWIFVDKEIKNKGIGSELLQFIERKVKEKSGKAIILETLYSDSEISAQANAFYKKNGYGKVGFLADFWGKGESKIGYEKVL